MKKSKKDKEKKRAESFLKSLGKDSEIKKESGYYEE